MTNKSTIVRIINAGSAIASRLAPGLAAGWLEKMFLSPQKHPMPKREQRWLQSMQLDNVNFGDGRFMPVWSAGPEHAPVILLVHGWSGRGGQLGALIAPLLEAGFRVVTWDAPAHGLADGRISGLPELPVAIQRIADWVGPIDGIIAHSMGAAATTIAVANGLEVNRLVYIAPPENPRNYLEMAGQWLGFSPAVINRTQKLVETRFDLPMENARGTALARHMKTPLLIIHDMDDMEVPISDSELLARHWKGARLIATRLLGHRRILRDTAVLDAATGFISNWQHAPVDDAQTGDTWSRRLA